MASGYPFSPPDHEEFRAICIKMHGNAKAIAARLNIIPHTLYAYFKKDPKAKEILDEVRGYNHFTDLDLAEHVNRYNMSQVKENPSVAQRAAEFTLLYKGQERGWEKYDPSRNQENDYIDQMDSMMKEINAFGSRIAMDATSSEALQSETSSELLPGEETA